MINLSKGKVILYLAAIFILGAVAGTMGGYTTARQQAISPPRHRELARHFRSRLAKLELTQEQMAQVEPIIAQTCAEIERAHRESLKRVGEVIRKSNQEIALFLKPDQKEKLEQMERERQELVRKRCKTGKDAPAAGTNN